MKSYIFLLSFLFGSILVAQTQPTEIAQYEDDEDGYYDDGYYDDGITWIGPGEYYGVWFNNQDDFNNWRRNYYWRSGRGAFRDGGYRGERFNRGRR